MTYAICYDFDMMSKIPNQDSFLQNFNRMRLESSREQPVLYVTMATWIPKCNVYHHIIDAEDAVSSDEKASKIFKEENISKSTDHKKETTTPNVILIDSDSEQGVSTTKEKTCEIKKKGIAPVFLKASGKNFPKIKPKNDSPKSEIREIVCINSDSEEISSLDAVSDIIHSEANVGSNTTDNVVIASESEATATTLENITIDSSKSEEVTATAVENITIDSDVRDSTDSIEDNKSDGKIDTDSKQCSSIKNNLEEIETLDESFSISEVSIKSPSDISKNEPVTPNSNRLRNGNSRKSVAEPSTPVSKKSTDEKTPKRKNTPKQIQKQLESEKKRLQKEKEREEREKQKQDEKEKKEAERLKKKEQKQKEIEQKLKEKEEKEEQRKREKEQKKIEKEQKEEQKRKEKEEEKLRKQQELDEKNKEKLKEEEKKQKAVAAFVSFFVPKKIHSSDDKKTEEVTLAFMPFEVKSDMKLPPPRREPLNEEQKNNLIHLVENNSDHSYLLDLKSMKPRTCSKTWLCQESEDDIAIIEDEEILGETICEEKPKSERMRAKFLKFQENQRPAYYGTWRKKSKNITGRKPFGKETIFDYEVDSDDDWEEEEQGENLEVVSDDDKENEPENEDYEVDNEFFVPHGHLSDDEVDDEENARLSPESQKQKLKLLKDAFDLDIKSKTQKIKPRSIGCIWYNQDGKCIDEAIDRYLKPLTVIIKAKIQIKKREPGNAEGNKKKVQLVKDIPENLMPALLKLVHGNTINRKSMANEFLNYIQNNKIEMELSKANILRSISNVAHWTKNTNIKGKFCWMVNEDVAEKFSIELVLPNNWESVKDSLKV
ncbi:hypothetical protein HHI36_013451 [Cryptolaemus montrouzieri]|uniref:Chromatin assembly factor 1 subunit A n=1 Tax=Cryptolaemus montrouzieri TaxID=559131 RepID=A0ABD2NH44_9CUCU